MPGWGRRRPRSGQRNDQLDTGEYSALTSYNASKLPVIAISAEDGEDVLRTFSTAACNSIRACPYIFELCRSSWESHTSRPMIRELSAQKGVLGSGLMAGHLLDRLEEFIQTAVMGSRRCIFP